MKDVFRWVTFAWLIILSVAVTYKRIPHASSGGAATTVTELPEPKMLEDVASEDQSSDDAPLVAPRQVPTTVEGCPKGYQALLLDTNSQWDNVGWTVASGGSFLKVCVLPAFLKSLERAQ